VGVGLSPRLSPLWACSVEVPLLSTMEAGLGCRAQLGGAFLESCSEFMVSSIFFSLFSDGPVIV
jgi:hypothetical protein